MVEPHARPSLDPSTFQVSWRAFLSTTLSIHDISPSTGLCWGEVLERARVLCRNKLIPSDHPSSIFFVFLLLFGLTVCQPSAHQQCLTPTLTVTPTLS